MAVEWTYKHKKLRPTQKTMLAQEIVVSIDGVVKGKGIVAYESNGRRYVSSFWDEEGNELPDAWYDVTPTGKEWLHVVPLNVQ